MVRQTAGQGLPIDAGLIEGGGKNTLARRLKINSARWRIRRAERMGAVRCLQYSNLWKPYWNSKKLADWCHKEEAHPRTEVKCHPIAERHPVFKDWLIKELLRRRINVIAAVIRAYISGSVYVCL